MLCFLTNIQPHLLGTEWQPSLVMSGINIKFIITNVSPPEYRSYLISLCWSSLHYLAHSSVCVSDGPSGLGL